MSDVSLAFAHPSERAAATADADTPRDRISVRDHIVAADIGAFQAERGAPQRLRFNVVVEVTGQDEPLDDDVDRILSYDRVTDAISAELAADRLNLLETLAENVAERVLVSPQAIRVFVRVEKLDRGPGALGVEIVRGRSDFAHHLTVAAESAAAEMPHPRVAYLSNAAIDDPDLGAWLDLTDQHGAPLILCVGAPDQPALQTGHAMTQRRIDLLAIEQNAWRLAARDRRCVVVATRTELDWAMRQGQISVWAPSKLVLDAPDAATIAVDGPFLAGWLASALSAQDLVGMGETLPYFRNISARSLPIGAVAF